MHTSYTTFNAAEFEDDESNGRGDFVTAAASNLRAIADIPPVDSMEATQ
jgi:hypothetical protein